MTNLRQLLDDEVGTPPPSTVDLDAIIAAQRRRARYRQAGFGISAGVVALAAVLVASTLTDWGERSAPSGGRSTPVRSAAASSTPVSTSPVESRPAAASGASADARAAEAARLTTGLRRLLEPLLPGAQFARSPLETALNEPTSGPLVFADTGTYFVAMAKVTDPAGVSNIIVRVGKTDDALVQEHGCIGDPPPRDLKLTCHSTPLSGGGYLVKMTSKRGKWLRDLAEVVRPGGQVVDVEIANSVHYYNAERPTLNLTMEQLTALATDAELASRV